MKTIEKTLDREATLHARAVTRFHGKTFYFASLFLPGEIRHAIWALYAYTRRLDDLVDESPVPEVASVQLRRIDRSLSARLARPGSNLTYLALTRAVSRFGVPHFYFHSLAAGLRMDLEHAPYERWRDLYRYCWRVASVVGLMVARTFGRSDPATFRRVVDCGIAMQLTNILRDVGEDLERGRIYLPREDMARFGVTPDMLAKREVTEPVRKLLAFEIARARRYYESGAVVLGHVRGRVRVTATLALRLYARILDKIEENGYDVFTRRASVSLSGKLLAAPRVLLVAWLPAGGSQPAVPPVNIDSGQTHE
ncbi:MAG: phytoene/squalene synthase family protein [Deltaproteobacteria bacterium]|nr:phytoene/squalene synthase family protein [Deltaproteobacteria bacterium]